VRRSSSRVSLVRHGPAGSAVARLDCTTPAPSVGPQYGWSVRIGLNVPSLNETMEPDSGGGFFFIPPWGFIARHEVILEKATRLTAKHGR
jgi:hypothetical protein